MREDQEGIKDQAWGCPRHPKEIFKESQASKLGDAQGIPFFINNYQVISIETIFLLLYILCAVLGTSLCFVFNFCLCLLAGIYNHYTLHPCLGERHAPGFYRMLFMLHLYLLSSCSCLLYTSDAADEEDS